MKIIYYFFTLCLLSFFNGVFMGQSSWRPLLNHTQTRRFVPIYYSSSSSRKSDSAPYETDSARRISNIALPPQKFQFTNETNLSYNQADEGYGLGLNVLHNRDGGQGRGAMSVNSYVGSQEPQVDAVEPRGEPDRYQKQNDIDGYFRNYQSPNRVKDEKIQEQMRYKPNEEVVSNEGKNHNNYHQNRANNAFDGEQVREINHFFLSQAPKKYANQPAIRNEFDQNKNPVTDDNISNNNYGENKLPIVNDRHPFLRFYNQNKNKFGNDNYEGNSDSKMFPRAETEKTNFNQFRDQVNHNNNFDQNKNPINNPVRYPSTPIHRRQPNHPLEKAMAYNNEDNYNYDQNKNPVPNNINIGFHSTKPVEAIDLVRNGFNEGNRERVNQPVFRNKPQIDGPKDVDQRLMNREPPNKNYLPSSFDGRDRKLRPVFENGPKQIPQTPFYGLNSIVEKPLFYGDFDFKLRRSRY